MHSLKNKGMDSPLKLKILRANLESISDGIGFLYTRVTFKSPPRGGCIPLSFVHVKTGSRLSDIDVNSIMAPFNVPDKNIALMSYVQSTLKPSTTYLGQFISSELRVDISTFEWRYNTEMLEDESIHLICLE